MCKCLITIMMMFSSSLLFCQSNTPKKTVTKSEKNYIDFEFKLYPTKNYWTFLKLDTRNGKVWQVHFSVKDGEVTGELVVNSTSLNYDDEEINGRFALHPTENFYNYLLIDQKEGNVFQLQWSMEESNRGIKLIKALK